MFWSQHPNFRHTFDCFVGVTSILMKFFELGSQTLVFDFLVLATEDNFDIAASSEDIFFRPPHYEGQHCENVIRTDQIILLHFVLLPVEIDFLLESLD